MEIVPYNTNTRVTAAEEHRQCNVNLGGKTVPFLLGAIFSPPVCLCSSF